MITLSLKVFNLQVKWLLIWSCFFRYIKNKSAESGSKSAENVRDTAPKIAKLEHKIETYKMA